MSATAGWRITRCAAPWSETFSSENAMPAGAARRASRCIFGGLPRITDRSMSTGLFLKWESWISSLPSSVALPMTANGQRSRSQACLNLGRSCGETATTYRSCASLHQISRGDMPVSSTGISLRDTRAPRPAACTISGTALDSPPAPTSWIETIGLASPSCQQRSITCCARRWISALPRCTESKSRLARFAPPPIEEAAPPPMPISMPGPPSCRRSVPAGSGALAECPARRLPRPPASMIGL